MPGDCGDHFAHHKFVYIGIPRTASKSMNEWLMRYYDGVWYGGHHDYAGIPDDARSFLVFTTVRNPYDRSVSGFFGRHWDDRPRRADLRVAVEPPTARDIDHLIERGRDDTETVPYRDFIEGAGVSLLSISSGCPSACSNCRSWTRRPSNRSRTCWSEASGRLAISTTSSTTATRRSSGSPSRDDFEIAGYERHNAGLTDGARAARWLRDDPIR